MFKKLFVVSVLIAVVCVPLSYSLSCYTCNSPYECKQARLTTCSISAANQTSAYLRVHHQNVREINQYRFECLSLKYTFQNNNTVVHQLHGCVHQDVSPCALYLMPQYSSWRRTQCSLCAKDKCNKSPAGKMSSSIYTIAATVLGLMLAKVYA